MRSLGLFRNLVSATGVTVLLGLVACSASDSSDHPEATDATSDALEAIHGLPVPATQNADGDMRTVWQGSAGELWLADAFASCSAASPTVTVGDAIHDDVLQNVRTRIASTLAAYPAPQPTSWMDLRTRPSYNAKPLSKVQASAELTPQLPERYVWTSIAGPGATPSPGVQAALAAAGVNLCMARVLHEQTQFGALLLAPAADQRLVHSAIRERAQLAMLHLTDILATLGLRADDDALIDPNAKLLRDWAASPTSTATLEAWGTDLADAVRLHIAATQTLVEWLARSAAARDALPSATASDLPSANDFSPASWRQRALAVLYGGDPLATGKAGAAAPNGGAARTLDRTQWPSQAEWGSATPGLWTPAAVRALGLARQHNVLSLVLRTGTTTYSSPEDIDVAASASWLYRDIEAALRTAACASVDDADDATSACRTTTGAQVTEPLPFTSGADTSELAPFRLWKEHQLRPVDVASLVTAIVDVLPATSAVRGLPILGGTRLVELPGRTAKSLMFEPDAFFTQRSPLELAALYSGMGRHRIPASLRSSETDGVRAEPLYSGGEGVLEAGRRFGAVAALSAVRDTLASFSSSTAPGVPSLLRHQMAITRAIDSAIGEARLAVRPSELEADSQTDAVVQAMGATAGTHAWNVRMAPEKNDPFWTNGQLYTLIAVARTPQAATWLHDPNSPKAGFSSLETLVASGSANVTSAPLNRAADGSFSALVDLADDAVTVLFVQRRSGRRNEYRAISGPIAPAVASAGPGSPVDAMYFAPGGALGIAAAKVSAVRQSDPSKPAFDGFGQLYESLPPRTAEIANADAPLMAYASRLAASASSNEAQVRGQLHTVLEQIRLDTMGQADVAAAQRRELGQLRAGLSRLCGSAANVAGSLDDLEARSAESACGVTTTTIDAYASTSQELTQACGSAYTGGAPATRPALDWNTSAQCPANPDAPEVTTEQRVRCMLDGLDASVVYQVSVATPVACKRYTPGFVSFAPVGGVLADRLQRQRGALQAYGDAVRELEAAGRLIAANANKADQAVLLAQAQIDAAKSRAENARRAGLSELASLTEKVAEAQLQVDGAAKFLGKLTGKDWKWLAKGGIVSASGAAAGASTGGVLGAAAGSGLGPVGTIIGMGTGAAIGWVTHVLTGPSRAEIQAAENALAQARLRLQHAQDDERRYAEFLGLCVTNPAATGGAAYGTCPPGTNMLGTVIDVYTRETAVTEQQKAFAIADTFIALHQASLTIAEKVSRVSTAANTLALESAGLQIEVGNAQVSLAEAKLEVVAAQARTNAVYGFSSAFHAADMWAVQGLLDSVRHDIVAARRATEFVTMSDLSTMTSNLSSVGAPALWADQVYDYDLSPLRVSGLAVGRPSTTTINETKLQTYLLNLGWASSSIENAQHVTYSPSMTDLAVIPGPAATMMVRMNDPAGAYDMPVRDPVATMWQVHCPASDCAPNGGWCSAANASSFEDVCKSTAPDGTVTQKKPTSFKLPFTLDPWGKFRNEMPVGVLPSLLNGRWSRFAVNLLGADIRNCSAVDAPPNCTSLSRSVSFTLRHTGPAYALGPSYGLTLLPLPPVAVTGIARTDGVPFNVFHDDLEGTAMRALRRSELWGYPLGGSYELELYPAAGQEMANVKAVELLFNATFWQPTGQ